MANASDFVDRVSRIDGIVGCVLIRNDGKKIAQSLDNPEAYTAIMQKSNVISGEVMDSIGFSYCRYVSFTEENYNEFYVFPIENYLLGVVKLAECSLEVMLETVYQLIGRVSTGGAEG